MWSLRSFAAILRNERIWKNARCHRRADRRGGGPVVVRGGARMDRAAARRHSFQPRKFLLLFSTNDLGAVEPSSDAHFVAAPQVLNKNRPTPRSRVNSPTKIIRWNKGAKPENLADEVALEEPLEIRVDNQPVSVTMRTPGHDEELAAGFLLSEGIIREPGQIAKISPYPRNVDKNVMGVYLAPGVEVDWKRLTRHVFVSSSCGLCGKASIDAVHQHFPPIETQSRVAAHTLLGLPETLRRHQESFERTGGLHAAGLFDLEGQLIVSREDVGRHNAVDKVLGRALLDGLLPCDKHILLVSGRASFEILQKALSGRIPIIAAVSAPSSLAVEFARSSGQTLVGFLRGQRMNVYAGAERLLWA